MSEYCVYVHVNHENGKKYYGRTKQRPDKRWQAGYGYVKTPPFFEDIKRIGWENFDHIVIAAALTESEANAYEAMLIEKHGTMNPEKGYNLRSGGRGNYPVESVCRNISRAKLGHLVSEATRQKLREKVPARQVLQISLTDGSIVAVHPSLTSAAQAVGAFKSNICAACMGQKPTCKGYRWEYADAQGSAVAA